MLTLNDGRSELWQWDTNRKLTVDADCSQVHFSNKIFGRSIDVNVVDGVAIIPDVLLQTDKDLNVWAFVGTAENGYTKISKVFKVNKRNKPADYVFTPTDQTTLGELVERLDKIEESQDPDTIKNAVGDYLDNNPIQIEETDPTVPEWAKQPEKPNYTAEEVGALPADTVIPEIPAIPSKLPNPHPLTFTGAVEATYDGSTPLTVNFPEGGGGTGDGDEWEFVTEIMPTETATVIYETFSNGYKKLHIEFDDMRSTFENPKDPSQVWFNLNGTVHNDRKAFRLVPNNSVGQGTVFGTNYGSYGVIDIEYTKDFIKCNYICIWGVNNIADYGALLRQSEVGFAINSLRLHLGGNLEFAATLKMKIWGVKA